MSREEIKNLVTSTIAKQLGTEEARVLEDTNLIDELEADSLDIVELVLEFEELFQVSIPDDDLEQMQTVGDFVNYLERKVSPMQQEAENQKVENDEADQAQESPENENSNDEGEAGSDEADEGEED